MISLEDRTVRAQDIDNAHRAGARLELACAEAGITVRTLQRWKAHGGLSAGDRRPTAVRPTPAHALTAQEREAVLRVANEPRFADMPPARIVPALADELRRSAGQAKDPVIIISADASATHQSVVNVMEAARMAGLVHITFATQSSGGAKK